MTSNKRDPGGNILAGSGDLRTRYELDYWGLANRKALEFILGNDDREVISVRADSFTSLGTALYMIDIGQRDRLKVSDPRDSVSEPKDSKES
jgi:hypothetical protein